MKMKTTFDQLRILFMDDDATRFEIFSKQARNQDTVIYVSNVAEATYQVSNGHFDLIYLDNDLGENQPEGVDFVKYVIRNNLGREATFIIHSMNPICNKRMVEELRSNNYAVVGAAGGWKYQYTVCGVR